MSQLRLLPFEVLRLTHAERSIAKAYLEKFIRLSVEWKKQTTNTQNKKNKNKSGMCTANNETEPFRIQERMNMYTMKVILSWLWNVSDGEKKVVFSSDKVHLPWIEKELFRIYEATDEKRSWHHEKDVECWCLYDCSDCENENSDCATSNMQKRPWDTAKPCAWNRERVSCDSMDDSGYSGMDYENYSPLARIVNSPPKTNIPKMLDAMMKQNNKTRDCNNDKNDCTPSKYDLEKLKLQLLAKREARMRMEASKKAKDKKRAKRQTKLTPTHKIVCPKVGEGSGLNKLKFTSRSGRVTKRFALVNTNKC